MASNEPNLNLAFLERKMDWMAWCLCVKSGAREAVSQAYYNFNNNALEFFEELPHRPSIFSSLHATQQSAKLCNFQNNLLRSWNYEAQSEWAWFSFVLWPVFIPLFKLWSHVLQKKSRIWTFIYTFDLNVQLKLPFLFCAKNVCCVGLARLRRRREVVGRQHLASRST